MTFISDAARESRRTTSGTETKGTCTILYVTETFSSSEWVSSITASRELEYKLCKMSVFLFKTCRRQFGLIARCLCGSCVPTRRGSFLILTSASFYFDSEADTWSPLMEQVSCLQPREGMACAGDKLDSTPRQLQSWLENPLHSPVCGYRLNPL